MAESMLSDEERRILEGLRRAQAEREAIPQEERIRISNPDKYAFPIGISEREAAVHTDRNGGDFSLAAVYRPGLSADPPWALRMDGLGQVIQTDGAGAVGREATPRSFTVGRDVMNDIIALIKAVDFFDMSSQYASPRTDGATLSLAVKLGDREKTVAVYNPPYAQPADRVSDFLRLWNKVAGLIPPTDR